MPLRDARMLRSFPIDELTRELLLREFQGPIKHTGKMGEDKNLGSTGSYPTFQWFPWRRGPEKRWLGVGDIGGG